MSQKQRTGCYSPWFNARIYVVIFADYVMMLDGVMARYAQTGSGHHVISGCWVVSVCDTVLHSVEGLCSCRLKEILRRTNRIMVVLKLPGEINLLIDSKKINRKCWLAKVGYWSFWHIISQANAFSDRLLPFVLFFPDSYLISPCFSISMDARNRLKPTAWMVRIWSQ